MIQRNIKIELNEKERQEFGEICGNLGISMSTAFQIFTKAVIRQGGIPFDLSLGSSPDTSPPEAEPPGETAEPAEPAPPEAEVSDNSAETAETVEMTLGEWMDYYMSEYKKRFVKMTTYINYEIKIENHIRPALGHYRLRALRQDIIQKFVNGLSDKGLSPSTVEDVYNFLRNALETAVDDGLMERNVAGRVKLPKVRKPKINVLTVEQQAIFIEQAKNSYMGNMYILDLCTGMRLGELLGLKWEDIDLQANQLHVKRIIRKVKDPDKPEKGWRLEFGTPKTASSERSIPLNETALKVLADVREQQEKAKSKAGTAYEDNDLVFCSRLGRPLDPANMRRAFYAICDKIGVTGLHPHCLRHTFATRGAENNVDVRVMQRFLGHATIQETADTYTHILDNLKRSEILKLDNVMKY